LIDVRQPQLHRDDDAILSFAATFRAGVGPADNQQNVAGAINGFFSNGGTLPSNFVVLERALAAA
jgi:hypothetical protein